MAELRSGSTVGGKAIATINDIQNAVSREQILSWTNKREKVNPPLISNNIDSLALNPDSNGTYQFDGYASGGITFTGKSTLINDSSVNARLQTIFANASSQSSYPSLYFRTGLDSSLNSWNRVPTIEEILSVFSKKTIQNTSTSATDMNINLEDGTHHIKTASSLPVKIGQSKSVYAEVLQGPGSSQLQRVTSMDGKNSYVRTKENNIWGSWISLGGGLVSFKRTVATGDWTVHLADPTLYEATITHSLNSVDVASVALINSSNLSVTVGFEVVNANTIKVFCGTQHSGRVIITALDS